MNKQTIQDDFNYYERAIEKLHSDYYRKKLIFFITLLGLNVFVSLFSTWTWGNTLIAVFVVGGGCFSLTQLKNFSQFIVNEKESAQLVKFSEDKTNYYILEENLKFSKKTARNLPSQEKGLTFFIGIEPLKLTNPIHIRYYDMLELSYTDQFKQDKANISYTKSRWKYRVKSWLRLLPVILLLIYFFFFRFSFIWMALKKIIMSLF